MITLICGRCQAGKTTYSKRFENVVHLDTVARNGRERYPKVLEIVSQRADDVVVDGVYEKAEYRTELLRAYKGQGSRCIWINTPVEVIAERMLPHFPHSHMKPNVHFVVPKHFEEPTYSEGWDEIIIIRNGEETHLPR